MNYRTLVKCEQSRRVSPWMRQALQEFRDSEGIGEVGDGASDTAGESAANTEVGDGAGLPADEGESLAQRVTALEDENRGLRELVEGQAAQLEELERRVAALEGAEQQVEDTETIKAGHVHGDNQGRAAGLIGPRQRCGGGSWKP